MLVLQTRLSQKLEFGSQVVGPCHFDDDAAGPLRQLFQPRYPIGVGGIQSRDKFMKWIQFYEVDSVNKHCLRIAQRDERT